MAIALIGAAPVSRPSGDERELPALHRDFKSSSGRFVLSISAIDGWRTQRTRATLSDKGARRWSRDLPHELGPRTAIVSDAGSVLLVDEWINSVPAHGLVLIAPDGRTIADHSGDAVFKVLGGPPAAISKLARVGTWRAGEPTIVGNDVAIPAAGRTLLISLKDGALRLRR